MEAMTTTLKQRWEELLATQPKMRIRNAAEALGVSEAELLATRIGDGVTLLRAEFPAILGEVTKIGRVMALTRNDDMVHERKGVYLNPTLGKGPVGLFVGEDIDLRIFWGAWSTAFAVADEGKEGPRYSLQFFAKDGSAIHKIYLEQDSDVAAYHDLVTSFRAEDQNEPIALTPFPATPPERADSDVDVPAFQAAWLALKDTHDFHMLVHSNRLSRVQALRLAPKGYANQVSNDVMRKVITAAADKQVPIMVFVGNRGMIQIHTGPVVKLMDIPGWFNVLDPDFNLHAREEAITSSWVVRKPTDDGMVTALECYNAQGEQLIQLFGKRKPGTPELESWRELIADLEGEVAHA